MKSDWKRRIEAQIASYSLFSVPLAVCCAQDPCLSLGSPVLTNNQFQFSLNGEAGVRYVIESSPDLVNRALAGYFRPPGACDRGFNVFPGLILGV